VRSFSQEIALAFSLRASRVMCHATPFCFKFTLDGRGLIWKRSGHCSDALDKPVFLQRKSTANFFQFRRPYISAVFAADFHGQLYFLYVNRLVRRMLAKS